MRNYLKDYADRFETVPMQQEGGVLELTFHTDGGPLQSGAKAHEAFQEAFHAIATDCGAQKVRRWQMKSGFGPGPDWIGHLS